MKRFLKFKLHNLFTFLLFFPFINLIPGPKVQPVASLIGFLILLRTKKLSYNNFILFSSLLLSSTVSLFILPNYGIYSTLISIIVLVVPLGIFIGAQKIGDIRISFLKKITILFFIISLVQCFPPLDFLFDPLRILFPIGKSVSLFSYRGVSLLTPEPSNAAFIIATLLWFWKLRDDKERYLLYKFFLIFLIVTNKSGTLLLLMLPFLINKVGFRKTLILFLTFPFFALILSFNNLRILDVINSLIFIIQEGYLFNPEYWYLISGPRFTEVYIAYYEAFKNPLGLGLGVIEDSYTQILSNSNISLGRYWDEQIELGFFEGSRPNSYLSYLAITLGITPLIIFIICLLTLLNRVKKPFLIFGVFAIILLLIRGTVTMPYPWIILGTLLAHAHKDNYIKKVKIQWSN